MAGPVSGGQDGWLWNGNASEELPESNWDLKVTKGELIPCPGVQIYGFGPVTEDQRNRLGIYNLTPKMWNGHPVYKNNNGGLLHMAINWSVAEKQGNYANYVSK